MINDDSLPYSNIFHRIASMVNSKKFFSIQNLGVGTWSYMIIKEFPTARQVGHKIIQTQDNSSTRPTYSHGRQGSLFSHISSVRQSPLLEFFQKTKQTENHVRYWQDCGSGRVDHWSSNNHLFSQIGPLFSIGQASVQQRLDPGERLWERGVQRSAHHVDKSNLHLGQFILPFSIHHSLKLCQEELRLKKTTMQLWQKIKIFNVLGFPIYVQGL